MNEEIKFTKYAAKAMSVLCVILIFAPFAYCMIFSSYNDFRGILLSLAAPLVLILAGYFMQDAVGRLTRFRRAQEDMSIEGKMQYFSKSCASLVITVCILCSGLFYVLLKSQRAASEVHFDPYSLDLYLLPALASLVMIAGAVMWFYPYHRIIRAESAILYAVGFIIDFIAAVFFSPRGTGFLSFCFFVFLLLFFIVCNLRSIEVSLSHSKFSVPDNHFRQYNLFLTLRRFFITLAAALILFSAVSLAVSLFDGKEAKSKETANETEERYEYELKEGEKSEDESKEKVSPYRKLFSNKLPGIPSLVIGCAVVGASIILVLRILYKKHCLKRFFNFLIITGNEIMQILLLMFNKRKCKDTGIPCSYTDKYLPPDETIYTSKTVKPDNISVRLFETEMRKRNTQLKKYSYAYSVYAALLRKENYNITASDTPRELTRKLGSANDSSLDTATPLYENISYRMSNPDDDTIQKELPDLCRRVCALLSKKQSE